MKRLEKFVNGLCLLTLINSVCFCLHNYFVFRSLWLDEAFVAVNVRERGLFQLFGMLDYGQQFPRYYLALVWGLTKVLSYDLWVLRLLPVLFAIGGVLLWSKILWEAFKSSPFFLRALVLFMFLMNSVIYNFAGDFKQYSGDLFFAGLGVFLITRVLALRLDLPLWKWGALCLACSVPVLFSYSYILIFCAGALGIVLVKRDQLSIGLLIRAGILAVAMGSFVTLSYFTDLRYVAGSTVDYWRDCYISGDTMLAWTQSFFAANARALGEWWIEKAKFLFVGLAYIGFFHSLRKKEKGPAEFLALSGGFLLVAWLFLAAMRRYPVHADRLGIFFLPFAAALTGSGLAALLNSRAKVVKWGGVGLTTALLVWTLGRRAPELVRHVYLGTHWENINPAMKKLDVEKSRTVLYGAGTEAQVRAFPHLPEGFHFIPTKELVLTAPIASGPNPWLAEAFYFLVATPVDLPEDVTNQIKSVSPRIIEQVDKHLYLVAAEK